MRGVLLPNNTRSGPSSEATSRRKSWRYTPDGLDTYIRMPPQDFERVHLPETADIDLAAVRHHDRHAGVTARQLTDLRGLGDPRVAGGDQHRDVQRRARDQEGVDDRRVHTERLFPGLQEQAVQAERGDAAFELAHRGEALVGVHTRQSGQTPLTRAASATASFAGPR